MQHERKEHMDRTNRGRWAASAKPERKALQSLERNDSPAATPYVTTNHAADVAGRSSTREMGGVVGHNMNTETKSNALSQNDDSKADINASNNTLEIDGELRTMKMKGASDYHYLSGGAITTSDDDFSSASDLLSRLSQSAISLQDQLCSAAFMGNEDAVAALLTKHAGVNACGMVSYYYYYFYLT